LPVAEFIQRTISQAKETLLRLPQYVAGTPSRASGAG